VKKEKALEWTSEIKGKKYAFTYQKKLWDSVLTVNGVPQVVNTSWHSVLGFDEKIDLNGQEARFVIENDEPDIVIDGRYVKSGEAYKPKPKWAVVFAFACLALLFTMPPGVWLLPGLLGAGGALAIVGVVKSARSNAVKLALCLLITVGVWVLRFILRDIGIFF